MRILLIWLIVSITAIAGDLEDLSTQFNQAYQAGDYSKAEGFAKQAFNFSERNFGRKHANTINIMNNLGKMYRLQGYYEKAEPFLVKTLAISKEVLGDQHPDTLTIMNNLAMVYQSQGRFEQAEQLLVEALAISKKEPGNQHLTTLTSMNNLAMLYNNKSRYKQAESLFVETLAISKELLGDQHPDTLTIMNNLAIAYKSQGSYKQAELLLVETLALRKKVQGNQHLTIITMGNLAGLYQTQGSYEQAEPLLVEILALSKEMLGEEHPDTLTIMNTLALLYASQGRNEQAEPLLVETLALRKKVLGSQHPNTFVSMGSLAWLYASQGRNEQAEPLLVETLAFRRKVLGNQHDDTITSMNNLAGLYTEQGLLVQAESLLVEALALRKKMLGNHHPGTLTTMNNLALLYQTKGRFEQAEQFFVDTLNLSKKVLGNQHPNTMKLMLNLALLYQTTQHWNRAKTLLDEHLTQINQFLLKRLWGAGEKTRLSYLHQQEYNKNYYLSFYSHLLTLETKKYRDDNLPQLAQQAWKMSINRKGLLLRIASEASALSKIHQGSDPQLAHLSQQIQQTRSQIAALTFSTEPNLSQQIKLEDQLNTFQRQISSKISGFRGKNKIINPEQILIALTKHQAVVDFLVYKAIDLKTYKYKTEQVIAFIADKETGVQLIELGALEPIHKLIQTYRQTIEYTPNNISWFTSKERQQTLKKTSQALYQTLWQPLTKALGNKKRIYLIPDGALHLLPLKALQNEQGEYLAQQVQLTRLGSVRDIVLPPKVTNKNASTIMANPVYSAKQETTEQKSQTVSRSLRKLNFSPLPGTKTEGESVQKIMQKMQQPVNLYSEEQASEAMINNEKSPRILHIATHGFFLENQEMPEDTKKIVDTYWNNRGKLTIANIENPLARSGLALTYANQGILGKKQPDGSDGVLTALEVLDLQLEGTELVNLSACETGVGEIRVGEGVYSLNRAFQEAGAKAVLSTLWSISDQGTNLFMQKFYQRFLNNQSAQQALRETQEEFKNSEQWQDPFFWAAFVMTGL